MFRKKLMAIAATISLLFVAPAVLGGQGNGQLLGPNNVPQGNAAGEIPARPGWFIQAGRRALQVPGEPRGNGVDLDSLSDVEAADLRFMRVEEMLARNVYLTLGAEWNLQVFASIAESEQRHMDAMKGLLGKYQVDDPVTAEMEAAVDLFPSEPLVSEGPPVVTFSTLYEDLVAEGTVTDSAHTQLDPLTVGAWIEERDMLDIWSAIDRTDNDDIAATYESLLCGSRNHLRSFVYQLEEIYGDADYEAQIVIANQEDWQDFVDAIIDSEMERCGRTSAR